jgi:hypothetical protein
MAKMTQYKIDQMKDLTNINVKLCMIKYIFSEEFSKVIHEFSKEHYREPLKIFRESWKLWISNNEIQIKIKEEIEKMRKTNIMWTDEEIIQKIYTSARFYYRKKEKKEKKETKENKNTKPYIGFTKEFIRLIDTKIKNKIKEEILQKTQTEKTEENNQREEDIETNIILHQKQIFHIFTLEHIKEINEELAKLKKKYDEMNETFEPYDIAIKCKKTFTNRFYLISKIVKNKK